jgi:DNA-binding NtrC family response regulator
MAKKRILVIDDDHLIRTQLADSLQKRGYEVSLAADAENGLEKIKAKSFDLVILDIILPAMSGIEAIDKIKEIDPRIIIILITAYGSKNLALEAINAGAYDYFTKPFEMEEMEIVIKRALEKRGLEKELSSLRKRLKKQYEFERIIGKSGAMQEVFESVNKLVDTDITVLIYGESGTGKELVAEAIHYHSRRSKMPFVKLNCVAIPEGLLESELFGHEKGAFPGAVSRKLGKFELANKGSLFLDEIGDMTLATQAKLLRVLQEREFERIGGTRPINIDARIIAATNRDLWKAVQEKKFREDLYFRLNVVLIHLPPLRERKADIPLLVEHFFNDSQARFKKELIGISREAMDLLMKYSWPGNVRELLNCIERAVVMTDGNTITLKSLPLQLRKFGREPAGEPDIPASLTERMERTEREMILDALYESDGFQSKTARKLGLSARSLWYKVKKHKIDVKKIKKSTKNVAIF